MQIKKIRIQNYQSFSDSGDQDITKFFALINVIVDSLRNLLNLN